MSTDLFVALLAGVLGLAVGSFLNVVVWRVPRGESVVSPPSACPGCSTQIRTRDNIPVLSWVLLGRRCRDCREPISARYPLVEAGTAVAFAVVAFTVGPAWTLPAYLYGVAIAIALTLIDIETQRLPNVIVVGSYPVVAVLLAVAAWGSGDWSPLLRAAVGAAALFAFYLLLVIVYPPGMGLGDVKLAAILGAYLASVGWGTLVVGGFAGFLLGGVFSIALLGARSAGRKTAIPFGPWMLLGAVVGMVVGERAWDAYLSTFS